MTRRNLPPPKDKRGGHMRLYWEVFDSPAWKCLGEPARAAYMALLRQKGSSNNGNLSLPLSLAVHHGIRSDPTLVKALRELCAVGLIARTRQGGSEKDGTRLCNLYRFTDYEVFEHRPLFIEACPATNEWKQVKSVAMGEALIRNYIEQEKRGRAEQKTKARLYLLQQTAVAAKGVGPETPIATKGRADGPLQQLKPARSPPETKKQCATEA